MPKILGIDSSLTGTGLAKAVLPPSVTMAIRPDPVVQLATVGARKPKPTDTWIHRSERVHEVLDQIGNALADGYDAVGLEERTYGATKGSAEVVLHWLWGEIIHLVSQHGMPLYLVNVSGVKKFATGNGAAKKDVVMLAMANRYPQYGIADNNQSDALAVNMMVARELGVAFDTMPQKNLEAMGKVVRQ